MAIRVEDVVDKTEARIKEKEEIKKAHDLAKGFFGYPFVTNLSLIENITIYKWLPIYGEKIMRIDPCSNTLTCLHKPLFSKFMEFAGLYEKWMQKTPKLEKDYS